MQTLPKEKIKKKKLEVDVLFRRKSHISYIKWSFLFAQVRNREQKKGLEKLQRVKQRQFKHMPPREGGKMGGKPPEGTEKRCYGRLYTEGYLLLLL